MNQATTLRTASEFSARCKAWSRLPVRTHRIAVDTDGTVRVYDSIAGHYTRCHDLSDGQQRRLRALAVRAVQS